MSGDHTIMEKEARTAELMIDIFCHGQHGKREDLCPECRGLLEYVRRRLERCPLRDSKPRCSKCPVHCYKHDMRGKIMAVMKYAGPRMLYRHPILTGRHYLTGK
ncbi:MAG: nitrous oxide-stimulated promoter family protein [Syntrophales bacterium]